VSKTFLVSVSDDFLFSQITIPIIEPITRTPPTTDNEIITAFPFSDESEGRISDEAVERIFEEAVERIFEEAVGRIFEEEVGRISI
jgi:hypothetical protein